MLLAELARFAHAFNLIFFECLESDDNSFRLHCFEFVEIDVANSLMPQLYVGVGFRAFCEHGQLHLMRIEDEHLALSLSA